MRLIFLTALPMTAFAANSILNRLAVGDGRIDPESFAFLRLLSGVITLVVLARLRRVRIRQTWLRRLVGGGALSLYMLGFSFAYRNLDAGLGALILFGVVQVTMFGWGLSQGEKSNRRQVSGAVVALAGLTVVLWPGGSGRVAVEGALFMILAGIGWAVYSLAGRRSQEPLGATADNFVISLVMVVGILAVSDWTLHADPSGLLLACLSGAVTSGMGYALWYAVLPRLSTSVAATVQLSVPVLALLAGVLFLGEEPGFRLVLGGAAVIGGIGLVVRAPAQAR